MSKLQKPLRATHGTPEKQMHLGDRDIQCYVLEDGTAVLSGRGFQDALKLDPNVPEGKRSQGRKLPTLFNNKTLRSFMDADLARSIDNPIRFIRPGRGGTVAKGYEATTLTKLCRVILEARRKGKIDENSTLAAIAIEAEIIVSAFSDIGIVATIYEITGYERDKAVDAYQKYLEKFLRKEAAAWVKRFPIQFFELMCDLKSWRYEKGVTKYYPAMGHIINDVVYSRLAPGILDQLKELSHVDGKPKTKYHSWLTADIGIPALNEHIVGVMALAKANTTWRKFTDQLARVFPVHNDPTIFLFPPDKMDEMTTEE